MTLKKKISCIIIVTFVTLSGCSDESDSPRVIEVQAVSCAVEQSPCQTVLSEVSEVKRYMTFSVAFKDSSTGKRVGTDDGYCLWVKHAPDRLICTKSAFFESGSINYGGLFVPGQKKNTFSIQGGTGAYENANGTVHVMEVPNAYRFRFVVTKAQ